MMKNQFILALDQGTTSSRAVIFNQQAQMIAVAQHEFRQIYPQAGWVEHDPIEICNSQQTSLRQAIRKAGIHETQIASIGISNQRETTIVWHAQTGQPIYNAIVWQCRRTAEMCEQLKLVEGLESYIQQNTGLVLDPYFSASKIKWILDNVPHAREEAEAGNLRFGTVDTWLMWKYSQSQDSQPAHVTDYTNASRTMLFNINTLEWDDYLLSVFDIPKSMMPQVKNSSGHFADIKLTSNSTQTIPIHGVAGDQQSSLFGHLCVNSGQAKNTYGTGCFMMMNTGQEKVTSTHGLLTTLACDPMGKPSYALEGSVFMGGASLQWLRDELKLLRAAKDSEYYATQVDSSEGVYVVPAFTGLGAPYWQAYARGTIVGMTRGTNSNHLIRATLESIAYQNYDVLQAMQADAALALTELKVDGGAVVNNFLMQFQADLINTTVQRPKLTEVTALGAAYLAGLAIGYWRDINQLRSHQQIDMQFMPYVCSLKRQQQLKGWQRAVKCTQLWAELCAEDEAADNNSSPD